MEKTQFVNQLEVKDDVNSIFLVKYIAVMEARDGKSYLNVILADNSGIIEGRKWAGAVDVAEKVKKGDIVVVSGRVNNFQKRQQLIIKEISKVSEENEKDFDLDLFTPKSDHAPQKMYEELLQIVGTVKDVYLMDLLNAILYDSEISSRLQTWPAAKGIHHAYKSGLLEHVLGCAKMGVAMSKVYKFSYDFVVAGTIVHDIGKLYELSEGPMVEYTDEARLLGHIYKSAEIVTHFCGKLASFPQNTKRHLLHIILSHHGEHAYGSPKLPQTKEAMCVHFIDLIDSKLNSFDAVVKNDKNLGNWSTHVKHLDRMLYKSELPSYNEYIDE